MIDRTISVLDYRFTNCVLDRCNETWHKLDERGRDRRRRWPLFDNEEYLCATLGNVWHNLRGIDGRGHFKTY